MQLLRITRTYTWEKQERSYTHTYGVGRVGQGAAIHFVAQAGNAICGSGNVGIGTRGRSSVKLLNKPFDAVTCKKCLVRLEEAKNGEECTVEIIESAEAA